MFKISTKLSKFDSDLHIFLFILTLIYDKNNMFQSQTKNTQLLFLQDQNKENTVRTKVNFYQIFKFNEVFV